MAKKDEDRLMAAVISGLNDVADQLKVANKLKALDLKGRLGVDEALKVVSDKGMEKQDDQIESALDEVKEKMRKELYLVKHENKVLKLGILQTGYVPADPEYLRHKTAMSYEIACEFNDILKEFKKECEKGPIDV